MLEELYYEKDRKYKYKIGGRIASSLMGFIIGFLCAAVILIPLVLWLK